eukprot:scaffold217320_cov19-Prasinocladus_malaysianus.AAC.1
MGLAKDGTKKSTYTRGIELRARATLLGEGCRGSLSEVRPTVGTYLELDFSFPRVHCKPRSWPYFCITLSPALLGPSNYRRVVRSVIPKNLKQYERLIENHTSLSMLNRMFDADIRG